MSVVDEYLKDVAEPQRSELERIRKIIKTAAPDAEDVITYGLPGFKYKGKYLMAFASFKDHLSIFPGSHAIEELKDELDGYKISRGTVQFTLDKPLPEALITKIVTIRLNDIVSS